MIRVLVTVAASAFALLVGTHAAMAGGEPDDLPLELRLARCTALRAQYKGSFEAVEAGKDPPVLLLAAARMLTQAEVDLVVTRAAQVEALEGAVARLREVEDLVARMVAAGRRPPADAVEATAARREAAARLRARLKRD